MYTEEQNSRIDELITSYLSGEADKASLDELKRWSMESEANRIYLRNRLEIWFASGVVAEEAFFDAEKAFGLFRQRVARHERERARRRSFPWKTAYRVAAVILLLLLPLAGYWQGQERIRHGFAEISVEAPLGARTRLYLPDGTLVWLNAGSKVTYSQGFGVDDRKLSLAGEGYFEVARNEGMPFVVETKELTLKVLGTVFTFRNYSDDQEAMVSLIEGKVALSNTLKGGAELFLEPNERARLDKRTGSMVKLRADMSKADAWTRDELFFDEEPLEEIARRLARNYDVKIEVADSLHGRCFYGSFKGADHTVGEILDVMASTGQLRYRREGDSYLLY